VSLEKIFGNAAKEFYSELLTVEKLLFLRVILKASVVNLHVEFQQSKA
jgi:hypothetical protein